MATSVFMAASSDHHHQTTNSVPPQDHESHPIRRSSGRRSSKTKGCDSSSSCGQKKNKTPQRGMGVEKLEKLLLQEGWKKMTEINGFSHGFNAVSTAPFCDLVSKMRGFGPNQVGFQYGQMDPFELGGSGFVSSNGNVVKCYSGNCNACHKKKKFNVGECGFLRLNSTIGGENHEGLDVGTKLTVGNLRKQEVEIVAVHRKGCSSSTEGQVMMEYEFFPSNTTKSDDDDDHDDGLMATMNFVGNYPEASTTSSSCATPPGFDRASNSSLDLSLKLSY